MSYLHDDADDDDYTPRHDHGPQHREVTLGTGTILAIFAGLVLLCGAFFAFGYNIGSRTRPVATTSIPAETPAPAPNFSGFKPAAGSPAAASETHPKPEPARPVQAEPADTSSSAAPAVAHAAPAPAPIERVPPPPVHQPTAADFATGSFVVQVAAVSHAEDAGYVVDALRKKGYAVVARPEPDHLIHIQVGPFSVKKDAIAMQQRLIADGYNAFIK